MNALILPGGGARFAIQAGKLTELSEGGYDPDIIAGVSAGALSGAIYATDQAHKFRDICENLSNRKVRKTHKNVSLGLNYLFYKMGFVRPIKAKYSNKPLLSLIKRHLLYKEVKTHYECGIVEVGDDSPSFYFHHTIHKGKLITEKDCKYILASTAIPGIFDPVKIDGRMLVDGGVRYNAPISPTIGRHDITHAILIPCQPIDNQATEQPATLLGMAMWGIDAALQSSFKKDYTLFRTMNRMAKQGCTFNDYNPTYIKSVLYEPNEMGDTLDFSSEQAVRLFDHGYELEPSVDW